jgi:tryptophan synthase beta chain
VGPEHAAWADSERVQYVPINDDEALAAFDVLTREEGILPALESSHAVAEGMKRAAAMSEDDIVIVNLSGRGDKDLDQVLAMREG